MRQKIYSHNFVSFMLFLEAVRRNRLRRCLPPPDDSPKILHLPNQVIMANGFWYQLEPNGTYSKHAGECPFDWGKKMYESPFATNYSNRAADQARSADYYFDWWNDKFDWKNRFKP